jgi:hypothetical protein
VKSLRIDRVVPGVGRIARAIGSEDTVQLDMVNRAVTRLTLRRKLDVLARFKAGRLTSEALFLAAFTREPHEPIDREESSDAPEVLYAVLRRDTGEVKLGTTAEMTRRLRHLQIACAVPLELLGTQPGGLVEERALHSRFASARLLGEWFRYTDEVASYVRDHFEQPGSESHRSSTVSEICSPECT